MERFARHWHCRLVSGGALRADLVTFACNSTRFLLQSLLTGHNLRCLFRNFRVFESAFLYRSQLLLRQILPVLSIGFRTQRASRQDFLLLILANH